MSFEEDERVTHGHGQTLEEMFTLRNGQFERVPDCVVWPTKHDDVELLVNCLSTLFLSFSSFF